MAQFFRSNHGDKGPLSEFLVREALGRLGDDWRVLESVAWLTPRETPADGETDFVLLHAAYGAIVLEAKGGAFAVRDGTWWAIDRRGALRPLGQRGPFRQAANAKHQLRRRLRTACPTLADRMGHVVCFTSGTPDCDLGPEAPPEIVLSNSDLADIEPRLIAAAEFLGIANQRRPIDDAELERATALLAPSANVKEDRAREVATFRMRLDALTATRIDLTERQLSALTQVQRHRVSVVYGPAGTGKTVLAARRARELLGAGRNVVVLCTSAQLVAYYRDVLAGEWPGRLAVGRIDLLLSPDANVLTADAVLVDEAQNLSPPHLDGLPRLLRSDRSSVALFCDLGQIRDAERRAEWSVPLPHQALYLLENLRNSEEIVEALTRLGYEGTSSAQTAAGTAVEFLQCRNGAEMRAACVQVAFDLVRRDGLKEGQVAVITEAPSEIAGLLGSLGLNACTDAWAFGRRGRSRLDIGQFNKFQGLERDVVVVLEPTTPVSPAALHRPSGSSSLPQSDLGGTPLAEELRVVLRIAMSRARSRMIVIGGSKLRNALGVRTSERHIRAQPEGRDDIIEIRGVDPHRTARARATRRQSTDTAG